MEITPGIAEIVGIYIGDGHIYRNGNKFQIGFTGSPRTDVELFEHLQKLIKEEWGKETNFSVKRKGLRMRFRSKKITGFLINDLNLCYGEGKCERVKIPEKICRNWILAKHTIRGIMDTDGTVFVSKKPRVEKYPVMEITTVSSELANQLKRILSERNFRLGKIRKFVKEGSRPSYRVALYGKKNIVKWLDEIGFSNKYKLDRAKEYVKI